LPKKLSKDFEKIVISTEAAQFHRAANGEETLISSLLLVSAGPVPQSLDKF
jgi:hypothetical protein